MKTSSKILLFGIIGCIAVFLILAIVFRMNAFSDNSIIINMHRSLHHFHRYHQLAHGIHDKIKDYGVSYVSVVDKHAQKRVMVLKSFDSVAIGGKFDVLIKKGSKSRITIEGDSEILPFVQAFVDNGALKIRLDEQYRHISFDPVKVIVESNKKIHRINLGGLINLKAMNIDADTFLLNMGGKVPSCILGGKVKNFTINAAGKFNVNAKALETDNTNITMAWKWDVVVNSKIRLVVSGFGKGVIRYYGNPHQIEEHGFGKISMIKMSKRGEL